MTLGKVATLTSFRKVVNFNSIYSNCLSIIVSLLLFVVKGNWLDVPLNATIGGWDSKISNWVNTVWLTSTTVLMVGNNAATSSAVIKSTDGGNSWVGPTLTGTISTKGLVDISTTSHTSGMITTYLTIAIGCAGEIYVSTDSGSTWANTATISNFIGSAIAVGSNGNAFAIGQTNEQYGVIFTSNTTAAFSGTWGMSLYIVKYLSPTAIASVATIDGVNVYAVMGSGSILYQSTDAGSSWSAILTNSAYAFSCVSLVYSSATWTVMVTATAKNLPNTNGVFVGSAFTGIPTLSSFIQIGSLSGLSFRPHGLSMIDDKNAFLVLCNTGSPLACFIYRTANAGVTWTLDYTSTPSPLYSISMQSASIGVAGSNSLNVFVRLAGLFTFCHHSTSTTKKLLTNFSLLLFYVS